MTQAPPSHQSRHRCQALAVAKRRAALALLGGLALATGCEQSMEPTDRGANELAAPPAAIGRVGRIAIVRPGGEFVDTDNNGYRDSARVVVFLYDLVRGPEPVMAEGELRIMLTGESGRRLCEWVIPLQPDEGMMESTAFGWGYVIDLSINDVANDTTTERGGGLSCVFNPVDGARSATTTGLAAVTIGPVF